MSEKRPRNAQKNRREPEHAERDRQGFRRDRLVRSPEHERAGEEERNQHQGPRRPGAPPDANESFAEIPFESFVKEDPGHNAAHQERRNPWMQPQDPRDDEEHRGTAPPRLTVHCNARLTVDSRHGGPTIFALGPLPDP